MGNSGKAFGSHQPIKQSLPKVHHYYFTNSCWAVAQDISNPNTSFATWPLHVTPLEQSTLLSSRLKKQAQFHWWIGGCTRVQAISNFITTRQFHLTDCHNCLFLHTCFVRLPPQLPHCHRARHPFAFTSFLRVCLVRRCPDTVHQDPAFLEHQFKRAWQGRVLQMRQH